MPYSVSYCNRGFYLAMSGVMTPDEIHTATGLILGSKNFDYHTHQIINVLDADLSEIDFIKVKKNAAMGYSGSRLRPNVRVAVIANDDSSISLCKEYFTTAKQLGSSWVFELFDNQEAAIQWADTN